MPSFRERIQRMIGGSASLSRGALVVLVSQGLGMALGYVVQVFFARWIGPAGYGAYAYALAWALLLSTFSHLGLPDTAVRFVPAYVRRSDWSLLRGLLVFSERFVVAAGILVALVGSVVLAALGGLPPRGAAMQALWLGLWAVPLLGLSKLHTQACRAQGLNVSAYTLPALFRPLLMLGAGFLLVHFARLTGPGAVAVAGGSIVPIWLVQRLQLHRSLPDSARRATATFAGRRWMGVAFPLLLMNATGLLVSQTDVLMIGAMRGVEEAGYYRVASRTAAVATLVFVAANAVLAPRFAALHAEGDHEAMQRLVRRAIPWIFGPTLLVAVLVSLASGPVLELFGPSFAAGQPALLLLLGAHLVSAGTGSVAYLLAMTDNQATSARILGWSALANLVLNYVAIRLLGLTGAALATAVTTAAWNIWMHRAVRHRLTVVPSLFALRHRSSR